MEKFRQKINLVISLIVILICTGFFRASGAEFNWTGAVSSAWTDVNNWSPKQVPGITDLARINPAANVIVNPPIISSLVEVGVVFVADDVVLTVAEGGTLRMKGITAYGNSAITIYGTLINNGKFELQTADGGSVGRFGIHIYRTGRLVNNAELVVNGYFGLFMSDNYAGRDSFVNNSTGVVTLTGRQGLVCYDAGVRIIRNDGIIHITAEVPLNFQITGFVGATTTLTNTGTINITTSTVSSRILAAGDAFTNSEGGQISNESCGKILIEEGNYANNGGTTINNGLIQVKGAMTNGLAGLFTNTGVLKAASYGNYTNNGIQVNDDLPDEIFTYGAGNAFTVNGIFTDPTGNISAGTFEAPDGFVPFEELPPGATVFYASISREGETCTYLVPFDYVIKPLPVTLVSFNVQLEGGNANLVWKTTSESNSSHFEMQHSTDAKTWNELTKINANGESSLLHIYHYTHTSIPAGSNYYRLKMVDLDGSFAYSRIVMANIADASELAGDFYPNPANGAATIHITASRTATWTITSTDMSGRVIDTATRILYAGRNKISLPQTGSGLRIVSLTDGREVLVRKLVNE